MYQWFSDAIFYHIYPLGLCGAPHHNNFQSTPVPRLEQIHGWLEHIQGLGANALYLGPLFESTAHGYDTADYFTVDRRLGANHTLAGLSADLHQRGMRLILDGVFNHVGRDFWAFRDVQRNLQQSPYAGWFHNLRFDGHSPFHDPFSYEGWNGNFDLVKLNLHNPQVREHLFQAIAFWVKEFQIDGLRLDTADCLDLGFLQDLAAFSHHLRPDFFLLGEVIHGDYRKWANPAMLDSVTNYECYKGLYSSHVDQNYFEIAYALNRQFGPGGLYRDLPLYAFADNHDVSRVASLLTNPAHLYPLYCLLFTMPGVPSIYYGSEWGLTGHKTPYSDWPLRPPLRPDSAATAPQPALAQTITRLAQIRKEIPALRYGDYTQLFVKPQQMAFARCLENHCARVMVNAADRPDQLELSLPYPAGRWVDALNTGAEFTAVDGKLTIDEVPGCWGRILVNIL